MKNAARNTYSAIKWCLWRTLFSLAKAKTWHISSSMRPYCQCDMHINSIIAYSLSVWGLQVFPKYLRLQWRASISIFQHVEIHSCSCKCRLLPCKIDWNEMKEWCKTVWTIERNSLLRTYKATHVDTLQFQWATSNRCSFRFETNLTESLVKLVCVRSVVSSSLRLRLLFKPHEMIAPCELRSKHIGLIEKSASSAIQTNTQPS